MITIDITKAKEITKEKLRADRKSLLEAYKESGKTKYKYHTIEKGL